MSQVRKFLREAPVATLIAASFGASPVLAEKANIKSMSFDTQSVNTTLHVISTDGQKWDKLKSGDVQFWGHMKLDTKWPGYVADVAVVLGQCADNGCKLLPALWDSEGDPVRDYLYKRNFSFSTSKIGVSGTGITEGDQIIARCNEHLQADGPTKSYSFTHQFSATFVADTGKAWGNLDNVLVQATEGFPLAEIDHARTNMFDAQVVCDPVIKSPTSDIKLTVGDFDVKNVKLFLTTVQPGEPGSNPGTVCPRLKVTSRAQTNQAGAVTMRIWRRKNTGPITSEVKQAWAAYDAAKNGYFATYETWEHAGTTATFQFKTEIVENDPFPPFDGWKDITVNCTGAGGGGLASNTSSSNPDDNDAIPPLQLKGDFNFLADNGTSCPRKAKALINFTSSVKDNVHYSLDCTNGHFSGVAKAAPKPGGGYVAPALVTFDVTGTTQANCALKSVAPGKPKVHTLKGHLFQCVKTSGVAGSKDLQVKPKPKAVAPQRKIACAGGRVRNGKCVCKRGFNAVAAGDKTFRCVRTVVSPAIKRGAPRLVCVGGVVRSGRCYCPAGTALRHGTCVSARAVQHNSTAPPRGEQVNGTILRVR